MNWLELVQTYKEEYIEKTQTLMKIPSVLKKYNPNNADAPFGEDIRKALDMTLAMGEVDGFKTKNIGNMAGHIEMGEGKEILGILGHLDVVPAGGNWTYDPFSAHTEDGKIYGRGAIDDKGPTIAAYIAMRMIKEQNIKLNKRVRLILGCDEESGMRGVTAYLNEEKMPDIAFAPDAEFPLIYGEKGIFSFDLEGDFDDPIIDQLSAGERYNVVPDVCEARLKKDVRDSFKAFLSDRGYKGEVIDNRYLIYGKNAHAAWPHLGVNAISLMAEFLHEHTDHPMIGFLHERIGSDTLGKKLGIAYHDGKMGDLTLNLALVKVTQNHAKLGFNIRYPRGFHFEEKMHTIREQANKYGLDYKPLRNSPPHYVSPDDPLVKTLHNAYVTYTGDTEHDIITIGGGTYARTLKKAVAFGPNFPGNVDLAHQADEHIVIDEMLMAAAIYAKSIVDLAGES